MKKRSSAILSLAMSAQLFLGACGTRDYAKPPVEGTARPEAQKNESSDRSIRSQHLMVRPSESGYLWGGLHWVGVPDDAVKALRCQYMDRPNSNRFSAFGATIVGGAVLGVASRFSGSWFFGRPTPSEKGHWFWNRLDQTIKTGGQGLMRGALFAGVCETLLAGGNMTPFSGVLGQDFSVLASAITLGGLAAIAAAPYVQKKLGESSNAETSSEGGAENPPNDDGGGGGRNNPRDLARRIASHLQDWSKSSEIGKGIRYRLMPGIVIIGIGAGFGLIVYDGLQNDDGSKDSRTSSTLPADCSPVAAR